MPCCVTASSGRSACMAGVAWMMFIAEQQFSRYFVTFLMIFTSGNAVFGYLGTVQSGMEFVMYMVIPLLVNSIGAKRGLLIVGLVVGARLIISGLCDPHPVNFRTETAVWPGNMSAAGLGL